VEERKGATRLDSAEAPWFCPSISLWALYHIWWISVVDLWRPWNWWLADSL
jgi:hypothetical protein